MENMVLVPMEGTLTERGRGLNDAELADCLLALTGRTGYALGDLPPKQGLSWLIRWTGRTWSSSCGGVSTEYLVGRGKKLFLYKYGLVEFDGLGGRPEARAQNAEACFKQWDFDLGEFLQPYLPEGYSQTDNYTVFLPFTNMTVEYINLLFIYAGRGYPFRFVDSCQMERPFPLLGVELAPEATDFSLYEMEMRVLSLLVVEQAFALTNLRVAAAERDIAHQTFNLVGSMDFSAVAHELFFGEKGLLDKEEGRKLQLYTVPFFENMSEAVDAFLEEKWSSRQPNRMPYRRPDLVLEEIPYPSKAKIQRVKDFCEEIWQRYGRFPVYYPPLFTQLITLASRSAGS